MMEAASTSETLENFFQATRHDNPQDSYLHTSRRENLKSHLARVLFTEYICRNLEKHSQHFIYPFKTLH
jgi:hypothetical protein